MDDRHFEKRLSRLEENQVRQAEQMTIVKVLSEDVKEIKDTIKIGFNKLTDTLVNDDKRLLLLETDVSQKTKKTEFWKLSLITLIAGIGGAILTYFLK